MDTSTTIIYKHLEPTECTRAIGPVIGLPYRTIAAMKATGKFWSSTRGSILFEPTPDQFFVLVRPTEIAEVLRHSGELTWKGAPVPDAEWLQIARAVNDVRFKLPICTRYAPNSGVRK